MPREVSTKQGTHKSSLPLDRYLQILRLLSEAQQDLPLRQIAAHVDLHPSTACRLLSRLVRHGYVERRSDRRYRLGIETFVVGSAYPYRLAVWQAAVPFLFRIAEQTRLTASLGVWYHGKVCIVACVPAQGWYERYNVGDIDPAHTTGLGKAILAFGPPEFLHQIGELHRFTEKSICTREALEKELAFIRQKGYALDDEETVVGIRCVAAPIQNPGNDPPAALSIAGPSSVMELSRIEEFAKLVKDRCQNISTKLGHSLSIYESFRHLPF